MSTEPCHVHYCVRTLGHAGCHTAAPSARTLDWDQRRLDGGPWTGYGDASDFVQAEDITEAVEALIDWVGKR